MDIINKKPYEKFPVSADFSTDLSVNETITAKVVACVNTATGVDSSSEIIASSAIATPKITLVIKAGVAGDKHKVTAKATTTLGNVYEKDFIVNIENGTEGVFTKQPSNIFLIGMDFTNIPVTDTINTEVTTVTKTSDGTDVTGTLILSTGSDGMKIIVGMQNGTDGEEYLITTKMATTTGYQLQIDAIMVVAEA